MVKIIVFSVMLVTFLVSLNGCATAPKQKDTQIEELRSQVQTLETQLQEKEQEISVLRDPMSLQPATGTKGMRTLEIKSRPTMKDIQLALKNAGYDPGAIDGKRGKRTREAIQTFQKANGLVADGTVGKKTWVILSKHLYQKIK